MAKQKKQSLVKDAIILCLISLFAALALGFVNEITHPIIAAAEAEKKAAAYRAVYPEAKTIEDQETNEVVKNALADAASILSAGGHVATITDACVVLNGNGETIGYVASVGVKGFNNLVLTFGYTKDGALTGLEFLKIEETPGFGSKADEPAFKDQFKTKKGPKLVAVAKASADNEIDAITGATFTTTGVVNGVNAGICFIEELQKRLGGAN